MTREEQRQRVLDEKARPILRALATEDGKTLLSALQHAARTMRTSIRPAPGAPVDPYQLARADGAQAVIDELLAFRDAAERDTHG